MAKNTISFFEIIPRTDNPQQEAIDYTNNFKDCIQGITSPQFIPNRFFVDYLDVILPEPRVPSEHSAQSKAKSINELYFWSSWLPWLKWKITGNDLDYKQYLEKNREAGKDHTQNPRETAVMRRALMAPNRCEKAKAMV